MPSGSTDWMEQVTGGGGLLGAGSSLAPGPPSFGILAQQQAQADPLADFLEKQRRQQEEQASQQQLIEKKQREEETKRAAEQAKAEKIAELNPPIPEPLSPSAIAAADPSAILVTPETPNAENLLTAVDLQALPGMITKALSWVNDALDLGPGGKVEKALTASAPALQGLQKAATVTPQLAPAALGLAFLKDATLGDKLAEASSDKQRQEMVAAAVIGAYRGLTEEALPQFAEPTNVALMVVGMGAAGQAGKARQAAAGVERLRQLGAGRRAVGAAEAIAKDAQLSSQVLAGLDVMGGLGFGAAGATEVKAGIEEGDKAKIASGLATIGVSLGVAAGSLHATKSLSAPTPRAGRLAEALPEALGTSPPRLAEAPTPVYPTEPEGLGKRALANRPSIPRLAETVGKSLAPEGPPRLAPQSRQAVLEAATQAGEGAIVPPRPTTSATSLEAPPGPPTASTRRQTFETGRPADLTPEEAALWNEGVRSEAPPGPPTFEDWQSTAPPYIRRMPEARQRQMFERGDLHLTEVQSLTDTSLLGETPWRPQPTPAQEIQASFVPHEDFARELWNSVERTVVTARQSHPEAVRRVGGVTVVDYGGANLAPNLPPYQLFSKFYQAPEAALVVNAKGYIADWGAIREGSPDAVRVALAALADGALVDPTGQIVPRSEFSIGTAKNFAERIGAPLDKLNEKTIVGSDLYQRLLERAERRERGRVEGAERSAPPDQGEVGGAAGPATEVTGRAGGDGGSRGVGLLDRDRQAQPAGGEDLAFLREWAAEEPPRAPERPARPPVAERARAAEEAFRQDYVESAQRPRVDPDTTSPLYRASQDPALPPWTRQEASRLDGFKRWLNEQPDEIRALRPEQQERLFEAGGRLGDLPERAGERGAFDWRTPENPPADWMGKRYVDELSAARSANAAHGPVSTARALLTNPRTALNAYWRMFHDRHAPVWQLTKEIEKAIGRPLDPGEHPGMALRLHFGGGTGPAVPVFWDIEKIIANAAKDGVLNHLRGRIDLLGWDYALRHQAAEVGVLEQQAAIHDYFKTQRKEISTAKGNITRTENMLRDAIATGDKQLAEGLTKLLGQRRQVYADLKVAYERVLKADPMARKQAAGKLRGARAAADDLFRKIADGELVPLEFTPAEVTLRKAKYDALPAEIRAKVDRYADQYQKIMDDNLDLYHREGMIGDDLYQRLKARGAGYVPMQRLSEHFNQLASQEGFNTATLSISRWKYIREFKGSTLPTRDPFDTAQISTLYAYSDVSRNRATRTFCESMALDPNLTGVRPMKSTERVPKGFQSVSFFKDGKQTKYIMPKELAEMVQYLDPHTAGALQQALATVGNFTRRMLTGVSLKFAGPNVFRDAGSAAMISHAFRHGKGFNRSSILYIMRVWPKAFADAWARGPWVRELYQSMAALSNIQGQISLERIMRPPSKVYTAAGRRRLGIGELTMGTIEDLINAGELATKSAGLQALKRSAAEGRLPPELNHPIAMANEVRTYVGTPDAARRGTYGSDVNMLLMFWNVGIQGRARMLERMAFTNPKQFLIPALVQGSILAAGMVAANAVYRHEDGKLMIDHEPNDQRDNNFMVYPPDWLLDAVGIPHETPEGLRPALKIRKTEEYMVFVNPIERALYAAIGGDPAIAQTAINSLTGSFPPVQFQIKAGDWSSMAQDAGLSALAQLNPLLRVGVEEAANRKFFTNTPIVSASDPESRRFQFSESTPPTYVALGQVGLSPKRLQHVTEGFGGGIAQLATSLTDPLAKASGLAPPPLNPPSQHPAWENVTLPGVETFVQPFFSPGRRDGIREALSEKFYSERQQIAVQISDIEEQVKRNDGALPEGIDPAHAEQLIERRKFMESGARALAQLNHEIRASGDLERRRALNREKDLLLAYLTGYDPSQPPVSQEESWTNSWRESTAY